MAKPRNSVDPLPVIELGTPEANVFLSDLEWALRFACANRKQMMEQVAKILAEFTGHALESSESFDVAHNIISKETFGGRQVFVHRKGAMPAVAGGRGIIPGSMGTASYIVEGLGNDASYRSCSHGAGRKLSRGDARRRISRNDLRRQMSRVVYPERIEESLIEEAPAAYKDIKEVLAQQEELARAVLRLEPIAVVKGM